MKKSHNRRFDSPIYPMAYLEMLLHMNFQIDWWFLWRGYFRTMGAYLPLWQPSATFFIGNLPQNSKMAAKWRHTFWMFLRSARRSLQTFLFLFCFFFLKVCRQRRKTFLFLRSADKVGRPFCFCSVSYYLRSARRSLQTFLFLFCFFLFFIILFYFSLQPPACCDFSIISQPISMKFGMLIVLDETNRLNIFSSQ